AKDAVELVGVGGLDGAQSRLQSPANIPGGLAHSAPVGLRRNLEAVILREKGELLVPVGLGQRGPRLLVEHIAQPLAKQQRKDELVVVARVDGAAQERGGAPEVGFELLLGDVLSHGATHQGFSATTLPSFQIQMSVPCIRAIWRAFLAERRKARPTM